jgi:hypothetical protein
MERSLASVAPYAYAILRIIPELLFISFVAGKKSLAGSAASRFRSPGSSVWQE